MSLITATNLSAVDTFNDTRRVFYQLINGKIQNALFDDVTVKDVIGAEARTFTPLATLSWKNGDHVRVYYLDSDRVICDFRLIRGEGGPVWSRGSLHELGIRACPYAGLAAVEHDSQIRVFYQEDGSSIIKDVVGNANPGHKWAPGNLSIKDSLVGTNIAAVSYASDGQERVDLFYQSADLSLKGKRYTPGQGWFDNDFKPGFATAKTPLSAINYHADIKETIQVFWRNETGKVVFKNYGDTKAPVVIKEVGPGYQLSVVQWKSGKYLYLFSQRFDGAVVQYTSTNSGKEWTTGTPI